MRNRRSEAAAKSLPLLLCLTIQAFDFTGVRQASAAEAAVADAAAGAAMASAPARASGGAMLTAINVRTTSSACHRLDEVNAALFAGRQPVGYDFAGADAGKLDRAMGAPPGAEVAVIRVVLLYGSREAIAFQFGGDGCHVMTRDMRIDEMGAVFERAGVDAPFGSTYYQGTGRAI